MPTYRVLKHVTASDSKECTSVAETESKIDEKVELPSKEKVERVAVEEEEETRAKRPVEEELPRRSTLRAEESESEGNPHIHAHTRAYVNVIS